MGKEKRVHQLQLEPLHGTSSRYISLTGLKSVKLKKFGYELRHWIGYREKTFEPEKISGKELVKYVTEVSLERPVRIEIPKQVSGLYHINDFYFKIFEQEFGHPPGFCRCVAHMVLSERLLYSESWVEIMGEIEKRGLEDALKEEEETRNKKFKEGKCIKIRLDDSVQSPEIQKMLEDMIRMQEAQKRAREWGPDILIYGSLT